MILQDLLKQAAYRCGFSLRRMRGVRADLIDVDGSHEEEDVHADLVDYWDLLSFGGVIFGDDYCWTGVKMAVDRFTSENRLKLEHLDDKWLLAKSA